MLQRFSMLTGGLLLAGAAHADLRSQDLFLGSQSTAIYRANAVTGDTELIGACGGSVHSMALVGEDLWIGTPTGDVYLWNEALGFPTFAFQAPGDARAMVAYGSELLVGGTDGQLHRYDPTAGTLLGTQAVGFPVHALCFQNGPSAGDLIVGSVAGILLQGDPIQGGFQQVGTCGGDITALASHDFQVFAADATGSFWRFESFFMTFIDASPIPAPATGIAFLKGDLVTTSTDGFVRRVSLFTGEVKESFDFGPPLDALALPIQQEPGFVTCVGSACPCDNFDGDNGCANSTGFGAELLPFGSNSVAQDDLGFYAYDLPPNTFALYFMGPDTQFTVWGAGVLCVSSGGYSTYRFPIGNTGASGTLTLGPGIAALSDATFHKQGLIAPGTTWYFQTLYRDPKGPCFTMNSSPAYGVTFQP